MLRNINVEAIINRSQKVKKVIVALSGGADSVCMLLTLHELGVPLEACHVNHMLRGEQSDNDETFVRKLCGRLGVRLHVKRIDVKALQKKHQSLEEAAREARYSYFTQFGTDCLIATAHTSNDNAETVLLNLLRGTALKGLCGIPEKRGNIIRPLLEVTREEVITFLEERGAEYVTDESNFSEEFTRNYLRLNIFPSLEKVNPSLYGGVSRMCRVLKFDDDYLHKTAASALIEVTLGDNSYSAEKLLNLHKAIRNRIISMILSKNNIMSSDLRIKQVAFLLKDGGKINLSKNKFAIIKKNILTIETIYQNYRNSENNH